MTNSPSSTSITSAIPGPIADTRRPGFKLPAGACDCHAHIFGPQQQYPLSPARAYTPPLATIDDYVTMLRTLGCERGVIVHPSVYGTDNNCTVDAVRSGKLSLRGIAVIDDNITDEQLEDMHQAGIRGVRLHPAPKNLAATLENAARIAARIKARGWHLQFYFNICAMPEIERPLMQLPVDVVIDHFAQAAVADGIAGPSFQTLLRLARHERCWFKLMGPYRISGQSPLYQDVTPFARALVAAAPERCVWGTDWPHPNAKIIPNDGDLADMLPEWMPDTALLHKVLVTNPARLYDFS